MQNLMPGWFNVVDPFDTLAWENTITKFKELYNQGGYLESLMDKYLLTDNTLTFTMTPEKGYSNQLAGEEETRLAREIEKIGEEEIAREKATQQELELLEVQDKARNEDLSCLPTVKVEDIPRGMERKELKTGNIGKVPIQWRIAPTNGLTYFRGETLCTPGGRPLIVHISGQFVEGSS
jgi:Zn-dependent M16 (insulinase) family peptidase